MKDLLVLAACKDIRFAMEGILSRPKALQIRPIRYDIPNDYLNNDPSCLNEGHRYLCNKQKLYEYALMILDYEGCGKECLGREALEQQTEERIRQSGWGDRASVILLDPELENWVWSDSPHVSTVLGWGNRTPAVRDWLFDQGFTFSERQKPHRPKEAVQRVLRETGKPRSANLYKQIASTVSLDRCADPTFLKLRSTLKSWFPLEIAV